MHYKTIALELLQQQTELYEQIKQERKLLATLESTTQELKTYHEAWQATLLQAKPDSDPNQIASEALEMAIQEFQENLRSRIPQDGNQALSLDEAMAYIRRHTSHGS